MAVKMDNCKTSIFYYNKIFERRQGGGSQGGDAGFGQTVWSGLADRFFIYAIVH
jgi:hypothetical protein